MERMNTDEYNVVVLINQPDGFLHFSVHFGTDQPAELSDTMIDMYDIVTGRELVQLLQRQRELSASCLVAFEVEFVEAVEQLVIREKTDTQSLIGKTFVYSFVDRGKRYIVSPIFEDGPDTGCLLFYIAQYI